MFTNSTFPQWYFAKQRGGNADSVKVLQGQGLGPRVDAKVKLG